MSEVAGPFPELPGPADNRDPIVAIEIRRAMAWAGVGVGLVLIWLLIQPLLLILAAIVFAAMLDGGTRLLGRILPIARGWRLFLVCIGAIAALVWIGYFAGSQIAAQAETLQKVIETQLTQLFNLLQSHGLIPRNGAQEIARQVMGSIGQVTAAVGNALGAISSLAMVLVLGIFIAIEPRLYERGLAWMVPVAGRDHFYAITARMGHVLRRLMAGRLLGMAVEGIGTGVALGLAGIPMATLLGLLTGLLAFLPNIGAIVSGVLIILVGFSAGFESGLWAIGIYFAVQMVDGYLIVPTVAKRSVDLAPALVLGAQILLGSLLGLMGLALADPIVAMIKVYLEERSKQAADAR